MTQTVSTKDLFPAIEAILNEGLQADFTVSGNSMRPWLEHGRDRVRLVSPKGRALRCGDIILFRPLPGKYILHRITKVLPDGYITTGDGNLFRDGFTPKETVVGVVTCMVRNGVTVECRKLRWRMLSQLWMAAFPVRKILLRGIAAVVRRKKARGG